MCDFVPGQAIAIGPHGTLSNLSGDLPGVLGPVVPLVSEDDEVKLDTDLAKLGTVVLKTDPGLELYAISHLSARLATEIQKKKAVVDLNHILSLSTAGPLYPNSLRLSPHAEGEVTYGPAVTALSTPPAEAHQSAYRCSG